MHDMGSRWRLLCMVLASDLKSNCANQNLLWLVTVLWGDGVMVMVISNLQHVFQPGNVERLKCKNSE